MKYLITESQFDRAVFLYLDYQNFVQIKKRHIIYFVNSEDNEYAQINYNKKNGLCNIKYTLIKDVSSLFSLDESDCEEVIGKWVENTLQIKVTEIHGPAWLSFLGLRIPN